MFFAGHGYTRHEGDKGYFVTADSPSPEKDETGFLNTALDMSEVDLYARQMEVLHALIVFDSCFSGTIFQARDLAVARPISKLNKRPVREFLSAGTADQPVSAKSVFTPMLIRALAGEADVDRDGYVTGSEIGLWVRSQVTFYTKDLQTPQFGRVRDPNLDQGDIVFAAKSAPDSVALTRALESDGRQSTPLPLASPAPAVPDTASVRSLVSGPKSGTLSYDGPPVAQNAEIEFNNLPAGTLKLDYDTNSWSHRLVSNADGTQRLILKSRKPGTQKKADVKWSVEK
jgi:hypothetical protein